MEYEPPTIVRWHNGRDVYVYPNGDRFYVDEIRAMLDGAEERRKQPLKVDDLDELQARLDQLRASRKTVIPPGFEVEDLPDGPNEALAEAARRRRGLVWEGIPLDDPDVEA